MKRYRECSFLVRCYRWWRYVPLSKLIATWKVMRWIGQGCPIIRYDHSQCKGDNCDSYVCGAYALTRWESLEKTWRVACIRATSGMKDWVTDEEMFKYYETGKWI